MGGVFRTVRVPANYTFTHLRSLIAWLFDTPARHAPADEYLFEVKEKVAMYSMLYKPGQIKSGTTKVRYRTYVIRVGGLQDTAST